MFLIKAQPCNDKTEVKIALFRDGPANKSTIN